MSPTRTPYNGTDRKLVLAFDIGTTYSAISYSILNPGHVPEIGRVTGFRGQKNGGESKIPTIIYYDGDGNARAFGAEALQDSLTEQAVMEGWVQAQWFKLHMRPQSISTSEINYEIAALPPNKSVIDLFADFMRYLYGCAKTYIQETNANGTSLWNSVEADIEYVLTHPNGWEGLQQQRMRQAAVLAGLIPDTTWGHGRVSFVTEGEASLHYCIQNGLTAEPMKHGDGILIVDAGGGTVDISAYGKSSEGKFEEISSADCYLQGSVYVTSRAHDFLNGCLRGSKYLDDVQAMTSEFDQSGKLTFEKPANPMFIRFGRPRDFDPSVNIRAGQLKLAGRQWTVLLMLSRKQRQKAKKRIASVFMVGGFSANKYLFAQVKGTAVLADVDVCRPDTYINKAVADGAASFYLDHYINVRVSKFACGVRADRLYNDSRTSHRERKPRAYVGIAGRQWLPGGFSTILPQGQQVSETREFRHSYQRLRLNQSKLTEVGMRIVVYRGGSSDPQWMDDDKDNYTTLCRIKANTAELCKSLAPIHSKGRTYFRMDYDVVMSFGLTEFTAQIAWKEGGIEKRGPADVIYDAMA